MICITSEVASTTGFRRHRNDSQALICAQDYGAIAVICFDAALRQSIHMFDYVDPVSLDDSVNFFLPDQ